MNEPDIFARARRAGLYLPTRGAAGSRIERRQVLKGLGAAGGLAMLPGLAACGGDDDGDSGTAGGDGGGDGGDGGDVGTVSLGSNYSDEVPRNALADALGLWEAGEVDINTVDHNTYQEQINSYLQGTPDDVFAWFAGFRMQFFAERGLATPITDVWDDIGGEFSQGLKEASTGLDGEQYFVPFYYYPWAVFYRKSVFDENGYDIPTTADEFEELCKQMQGDGLVPLAFADKGGWEAMGTFDYFNLRTNGAAFHRSLMAGEEDWTSDQVRETFTNWERFLPYHQQGALGREWQEAAQGLVSGDSGMFLMGMFVGQQFPDDERDDLDFFAFPEINPEHGQNAVEAPIDGFMVSADPNNEEGAKALCRHLASAEAQAAYLASDPNNIATNDNADTSGYNALQTKAVELIGAAEDITQFLDRDTRPDFASTVMIPSLQAFIQDPSGLDSLLQSIEDQKQAIFQG